MKGSFPLPDTEWEPTRGFWEAAQRESLQIPRCEVCATLNWYPPTQCRSCGADTLVWSEVSGRGTAFSWSVVSRALFGAYASQAPYISGLVALEEDPRVRLVTLFVDCGAEDLEVDLPVEVVFRELRFPEVDGGVVAPMFRPRPT